MATKNYQIGIRFSDHQTEVIEEIATKYVHTPTGVVRLAVEQLIQHFEKTGQVPGLDSPGPRRRPAKEKTADVATVGGAR